MSLSTLRGSRDPMGNLKLIIPRGSDKCHTIWFRFPHLQDRQVLFVCPVRFHANPSPMSHAQPNEPWKLEVGTEAFLYLGRDGLERLILYRKVSRF